MEINVCDAFRKVVTLYHDRVAVEEETRSVTFRELDHSSEKLAMALGSRLIDKEIVMVVIPSSISFVTSLIAIFKADLVFLPVSLEDPVRLKNILAENRIGCLIVGQQQLEEFQKILGELRTGIDRIMLLNESSLEFEFLQHEIKSNTELGMHSFDQDSAYIFYTSGSTGEPKAILGSHRSLMHFITWEVGEFDIQSDCRVSNLMRTTFDASLRDIFVPLCVGGTLCIPARSTRANTVQLIDWIQQRGITHMHTVPSLLRILISEIVPGNQFRFDSLKFVFASGEMMYGRDASLWRKQVNTSTTLVNFYGPTETTMIRSYYVVKEVPADPGVALPVGVPIDDTQIAVINDGVICPPGEIGEVYIKTAFPTAGYLYDKALTDAVFVRNPITDGDDDKVYKTGDLGRMHADGNLEILGRIDSQVKVNGIRVGLEAITKVVLGIIGVTNAIVIVERNEEYQNEVICFFTGNLSEHEVRQQASHSLDAFMMPSWFQRLEEMPLGLNGKINRRRLPTLWMVKSKGQQEEELTPLQEEISKIWQGILNVKSILKDTSFFAAGGTSLKAMQLISRLFKKFNVKFQIEDIFSQATIAKQAAFIHSCNKRQYDEIPLVKSFSPYEASPAQLAIWTAQQYEGKAEAYIIRNTWELVGKLNYEAFNTAVQQVINRHEVLRTIFDFRDDKLFFTIGEPIATASAVSFIDLSNQEVPLSRLTDAIDTTGPANGPLFKVQLVKVSNGRHFCIIQLHHLISDGWSINVFLRDLVKYYNGFVALKKVSLDPLRLQFKEILAWQRQRLNGEEIGKLQNYWKSQFNDIDFRELPTDHERPLLQSFKGETIVFPLKREDLQKARVLCQEQDTTIFMFLLSAISVLLYSYSGEKSFLIAVPLAGRDHDELENQIGLYVNVLPFVCRMDAAKTVSEHLGVVRKTFLEGLTHSGYPILKMLEELNVMGTRKNSCFDVMVQMQDTDVSSISSNALIGIETSEIKTQVKTSKFNLTFDFRQIGGDLEGRVEYNSALFDQSTILERIGQLQEIISTGANHKERTIEEVQRQFKTNNHGLVKTMQAFNTPMVKA
jgi:amino acid adenylation domain-containing protein